VIRGIIFDLDGVLVDSLPCHFAAWREFLGGFGVRYTKAQFVTEIGPSTRQLMAGRIKRHRLPVTVDEGVRRKEALFEQRLLEGPIVFEGVRRMLAGLKPYALAVATSAGRRLAQSVLASAGVAARFRAVVTSDDVRDTKPAPDVFLEAARRLRLGAGECVAVDDAPSGISAARRARMRVIGVATSFRRSDLVGADAVVKRTADVPGLLRAWQRTGRETGTLPATPRRPRSG